MQKLYISYNKDNDIFYVRDKNNILFVEVYETLEEAVNRVNGNLDGSYLLGYEFSDAELDMYDFDGAILSSEVMLKLGIYDDTLHRKLARLEALESDNKREGDLIVAPNMDINNRVFLNNDLVINYISDIHLAHKILKRFPRHINEIELHEYMNEIAASFKESLPNVKHNIVIIAGDTALSYDLFKMFQDKLFKELHHNVEKIIYVLGNHELWDEKLNERYDSIEDIVAQYKKACFNNKTALLENEIYVTNIYSPLSSRFILESDKNKLRKILLESSYVIFGGIGYAGLNERFNYNTGIYRGAPINRKLEIERSKITASIHKKLMEVASDIPIYFVTHMPKEDWSNEPHNPNWIYINGHTHNNYFENNSDRVVYADNQLGYKNTNFSFKQIEGRISGDYFKDYSDGIYEIEKIEYLRFYRALGYSSPGLKKTDNIIMIKREGYYCFLSRVLNGYCIMDGGKKINLEHNITPEYIFDNMKQYADSINSYMKNYTNFQKEIAAYVRRINTNSNLAGNIHGCIIDIDYYDHLYINPIDGTITPYYALSIVDKTVYKNLASLLEAHNKECLKELLRLQDTNNNLPAVINETSIADKGVKYLDTDIYKINGIVKSLQYITNNRIIRKWNNSILNKAPTEAGRLIVKDIINENLGIKVIDDEPKKIVKDKNEAIYAPEEVIEPKEDDETIIRNRIKRESSSMLKVSKNKIDVVDYDIASENRTYRCLDCGYEWKDTLSHMISVTNLVCPKCKNIK